MGKTTPKSPSVPRELEGSATQKDVHDLEERLGKTYSTERYEDFQEAVKKITLETIDSGEGRTKIKTHGREATKEYLDENSWKKLVFWIPILVSVISIVVAVWAVLYK